MKKINLLSHLTAVIIVTIVCGLIYATVQQSHRSAANDPQLQIAMDLKNAVENNQSLAKWMTDDTIEISQSLSVFKTLYDKNGEAVQSTGYLNGGLPQLPQGVFAFTNSHQEDVVSWQPQRGVRMAMVIEAAKSPRIGFVAVGRSLKEVENRESRLVIMVIVAWLVCLGIILLHFLLVFFSQRKNLND